MKKINILKDEIAGFNDVSETVKVIEKEAASHIHFLKKKVSSLTSYREELEKTLSSISDFYDTPNTKVSFSFPEGKRVLLVMSGTRGVVGGLYHKIVNKTLEIISDYDYIWVIGEKAVLYFDEEKLNNYERLPFHSKGFPEKGYISNLNEYLINRFHENKLKTLDILFPKFLHLSLQIPIIVNFLPFNFTPYKSSINKEIEVKREITNNNGLPIFEPSKSMIFGKLLENYVKVYLAEIFYETKLSEFSARTVTAESASKETENLTLKLSMKLLKERHRMLTQTQLESFAAHK